VETVRKPAAKNGMSESGIYGIFNLVNGKVYVGSAVCLEKRLRVHCFHLRRGTHINAHLQAAWKKYSEANFCLCVLERINNLCDLLNIEQYYIDWLDACDPKHGYNKSPTAGSSLGRKHSGKTKAKMSAARKGKPGHKWSLESRAKLSGALKGKPCSNRGWHMSEEHKARISATHKGVPKSEEQKRKLSLAKKGKPLSEEHKTHMADVRRGKSPSPETRIRMSASQQAAWKRRKEMPKKKTNRQEPLVSVHT
jgi:group I intron endonuclease